jgi:hypothetical protein
MKTTDTDRLRFLMTEIEGFQNVEKDRYEFASDVADERGNLGPSDDDELEGFRRLIDAAMGLLRHD